jgi:uncharacterized SAM-binding protein YcdF (DUF218 family)
LFSAFYFLLLFLPAVKRKSLHLLSISCFLLFLGLFLCLFRSPILRGAARLWIVEDPMQNANAVALLGTGTPTPARDVVAWYKSGVISNVILVPAPMLPIERLGVSERRVERQKRALAERGIRPEDIHVVGTGATNTFDALRELGTWARQSNIARVIIPASLFETRRVRWSAHKAAPGLDIIVRSALHPDITNDWWRSEAGLVAFENEVVSYLYSRMND